MVTHRHILAIAIPIVISNVSTPLVGLVDTAVMGRLEDPAYIGAIALGAIILSFLFWGLGFLRMSTTALTAQAEGAANNDEVRACLGRALVIGIVAGCALILLRTPLNLIAFKLVNGTARVESLSAIYFDIRIWSAPAVLANYVLLGWFIGLGQSKKSLIIQLLLNAVNLVLDVYFVLGLDLGVAGVAAAAVIAEFSALGLGLWMMHRELGFRAGTWALSRLFDWMKVRRTLAVNRDIMIRTLCLIFAFSWFTAQSAKGGDIVLAANAILLNFITLAAYFLDGFALAAETLVGQAMGANNQLTFNRVVKLSTIWAFVISVLVSVFFWLAGEYVISFLTVNAEVRALAAIYLPWAAVAPAIAIFAYQLDGIYNGVTRTSEMRNFMIISLGIYLTAWWLLVPQFGNHGLWASLLIFLLVRGLTLGMRYPALVRATFP